MTLLPLTRTGPADDIAEALRQEILGGLLPPGTPSTTPTCRAAGRSARRRACGVGRLEREGLLVHSLHRGLEVVRLSVDDVRDLYATRRTLELAGLEAMVRGRPADDVWLQAAVTSMTEAAKAGDGRAAVAADAAFHLAIVASTPSRRLRIAAEAALRELRIVLAVADRVSSDLDDLAADHAGLMDALDPRAAAFGARRAARPPAPRRVPRARGHARRLSALPRCAGRSRLPRRAPLRRAPHRRAPLARAPPRASRRPRRRRRRARAPARRGIASADARRRARATNRSQCGASSAGAHDRRRTRRASGAAGEIRPALEGGDRGAVAADQRAVALRRRFVEQLARTRRGSS